MPRGAKRPLTVVLLVVSIMAASVTPALAGSAGGTGGEKCGVFGSPDCLPRGECLYAGGELLIGGDGRSLNIRMTNPPQRLVADCQADGKVDGKVGLMDEIPVDAEDNPYAT